MTRATDASTENAENTTQRKGRGPLVTSLPTNGTQRCLTLQQARAEFGIPEASFRSAVASGALRRIAFPPVKDPKTQVVRESRRWWLDRRDVERFLDSNKTSGTAA